MEYTSGYFLRLLLNSGFLFQLIYNRFTKEEKIGILNNHGVLHKKNISLSLGYRKNKARAWSKQQSIVRQIRLSIRPSKLAIVLLTIAVRLSPGQHGPFWSSENRRVARLSASNVLPYMWAHCTSNLPSRSKNTLVHTNLESESSRLR
ncbi:hypothetical protein AVEN_147691-1 [Araneus ventricosus]|uniref:Uncharacterized protein n=1 Tax=Araneus ventricosus TaxID=182803 RepID=A0A4Y2MBC7_ARAVE|nr:hypothetical protein AVEN_147691-1 [Araneus ventricosus]